MRRIALSVVLAVFVVDPAPVKGQSFSTPRIKFLPGGIVVSDPATEVSTGATAKAGAVTAVEAGNIAVEALRIYRLAYAMSMAIKTLPAEYTATLKAAWAELNPARACTTCAVWVSAATYGDNPGTNYGGAVSTLQTLRPSWR